MSTAEVVVKESCILGESPIWSVAEQVLYWVDVLNPSIHRFDPATGAHDRWLVETEIGSIGLASGNRLVAGLRMGFALYDLGSSKLEFIDDPEGHGRQNTNRLNDGKVDRAGRFWCGSMQDPGREPVGTLYRMDTDRSVHAMADGIRVPNALCWSPDDRTMYFADTYAECIWAYNYDLATGAIENRRVFAEAGEGPGRQDGATVDSEGFVWNAQIFAGCVVRYDPHGRIEREIVVPTPQVTSCAFGGPDLDILYITTASMRMSRDELAADPLAGSLFAVDTGVRGLPEPRFGG
jgi:sugar lactone lactonase YvrE